MRIRTIKPEFWASEDIAALTWDERLTLIGLWSYVDDNGVGRDIPKLIVASLFPLEEDPRETLARVSRALASLAEAGRIVRYTVAGRDYLEIVNWSKHQRIDKPNKPRYPDVTCENAVIRETLARVSRDTRETLAPGAVEQGNRGTGDSATRGAVAPAAEPTAQTLIAEWIDHCTDRPPSRVIGQLSREVKTLLDEGIPYDVVRHSVAAWHRKALHPSSLASVVHEVRNPRTAGNGTTRPTTDQRVLDAIDLARRLAEQEHADAPLEIGA